MVYILEPLTIIATLLSFSILIWTLKTIGGNMRTRIYFALMLAIVLYTFGYSQEIIQTTENGVLFWIHFEYLGISFIPSMLILLGIHCRFYEENQKFSPLLYLLFAPGFLVLTTNWLYPVLPLFYKSLSVDNIFPFLEVSINPGPFYYVHICQTIAAITLTITLFLSEYRISTSSRKFLYLWMMLGVSIPGLTFLLYIFAVFPKGIDPIPISMSFIGPFMAAGVFSNNLINDMDNARSKYYKFSPNPSFIFNRRKMLIDMNKAAESLLNLKRPDVLNKKWKEILSTIYGLKHVPPSKRDGNASLIEHNERIYKLVNLHFSDKKGRKRGNIRILYDHTEISRAMKVLTEKATIDELTGISNRRHWENCVLTSLQQARRYKHAGSLLVIDLDKFKSINDTYGHQAGDTVLKEAAQRLKAAIREIDILGRYGGEEFCIWLPETEPESAKIVAERCRLAIRTKFMKYKDQEFPVTTSIGIFGENPVTGNKISDYFEPADQALYNAKEFGRDRCVLKETTSSD